MTLSAHKAATRRFADEMASERDYRIRRNANFYAENQRYTPFLVPEGLRVLDLGCGTGQLLASLNPARGTGIDPGEKIIEIAHRNFPHLEFQVGNIEDPRTREARLIVAYYSPLWEPILSVAELVNSVSRQPRTTPARKDGRDARSGTTWTGPPRAAARRSPRRSGPKIPSART